MSKSLSDLISVYKAHGRLEGEMVKAFLEANGVRSIISQEAAGSIYGLTLGDLGIVTYWFILKMKRLFIDKQMTRENLSKQNFNKIVLMMKY